MSTDALIIKKRLGRLNTDPGYINIILNDTGDVLTINDDAVTFDPTVTEPILATADTSKALIMTRNLCKSNGIESEATVLGNYQEQAPWTVKDFLDGWYSVMVFYIRKFEYDINNQASVLATIEAETEKGSVIAYCYQGVCSYYTRMTDDPLTVFPHIADNTEWQSSTYSDFTGFAKIILNRSGASTTVGELGMQQILLTPNAENKLYDLAIADASCMSCCDQVSDFNVLWTRLFAARALFCRGNFSDSAKLVESLELECKKIEDCDCC